MRLGYITGMGLLNVFVGWLVYAFSVFEEVDVLIPAFVAVIGLPLFGLYFFIVYYIGKHQHLRKPILLLTVTPMVLFVGYKLITDQQFMSNVLDTIEEDILYDRTPEIGNRLVEKADTFPVGETIDVSPNIRQSTQTEVHEKFYDKSFILKSKEEGLFKLNIELIDGQNGDAEISLYGENRELITRTGVSAGRPTQMLSFEVEAGEIYYITLRGGMISKEPIKKNLQLRLSSRIE
ncbi:hypothetical protein [Caldalkalibacillus salinus]|uniref:hypothetical protein n=1 Tax=Caldalkalibacillus salinus TaxID=2803787 RepID=UPI001921481E|nr:hypothetical protein [Caldalkalibacillus salinus]